MASRIARQSISSRSRAAASAMRQHRRAPGRSVGWSAERNAAGERRAAEAPGALGEARRGEVEVRERREDREVVEAGHRARPRAARRRRPRETSAPRGAAASRRSAGRPQSRAHRVAEPLDAEERQRESRSRAADRRTPRPTAAAPSPARPAARLRNGSRGAVDERKRRARAARTVRARSGSRSSRRSHAGAPSDRRSSPRERRCRGDAGARDAVVEAQHPDPAAVEDVVQRGVVRRVRRRPGRGKIPIVVEPRDVRRSACRGPRSAGSPGTRLDASPSARWRKPPGPVASIDEAGAQPRRIARPGRAPRCRTRRAPAAIASSAVRSRYSAPSRRGLAREERGRSRAGTSACRRPRRAGSPRRAAGRSGPASPRNGLPELVARRT